MKKLSNKDFDSIYSKVPRLNIDVVIRDENRVLLLKRAIEPNIGKWSFPGGTLYKGEFIADAAVRIAKAETGLECRFDSLLGYMEFPDETRGQISVHTVSLVIEVIKVSGNLCLDRNALEIASWSCLPDEPIISEHKEFLRAKGILLK